MKSRYRAWRWLSLGAALIGLCTALSCLPRSTTVTSRDINPKFKLDWKDPSSVVEAFLRAKKRGDWKTAYKCCDFEERLPRREARAIKKAWQEEAPLWPRQYFFHRWIVDGWRAGDAMALVRVNLLVKTPEEPSKGKSLNYDEVLRLYGRKWKITEYPAGLPEVGPE